MLVFYLLKSYEQHTQEIVRFFWFILQKFCNFVQNIGLGYS